MPGRWALLLAALAAAAAGQQEDLAATAELLAADDECSAGEGPQCSLSALQLRAASAKSAAPPAPAPGFACSGGADLGPVVGAAGKGIALDDTTFKGCAGSIPHLWPNTHEPVTSLRLFKAWDPEWPAEHRQAAWASIVDYVHRNGVKVLLGTEITCNETLDAQSWAWAKELLGLLGPSHVMGLAVGNELELLFRMGNRRPVAPVTPECVSRLWAGGYVLRTFRRTVADFDAMGFSAVPVTSVLGGYSLAGSPFVDTHSSGILTFLKAVTASYGRRFVFTFNFYPYFDTNMHLDHDHYHCHGALGGATCWRHHCFMPSIVRAAKSRVSALAPGSRFWLGETGWSSPLAPSLASQMSRCPAWSATSTLRSFYQGFLHAGDLGVDHVFYFTVRDSQVFGVPEHFGLISSCSSAQCKLGAGSSLAQAEEGPQAPQEAEEAVEFTPERLAAYAEHLLAKAGGRGA